MREVLIDVTRLLDRRWNGNIPTGVDRVSLEYIRHYANRARAIVRYYGRSLLASKEHSQQLFQEILNPSGDFKRRVVWLLTLTGSKIQNYGSRKDCILLNTGHNGLDQKSYPSKLEKQKVKPVFFIHDLIPLQYPEYCRSGEFQRHTQRIHAALKLGRGIITNSNVTLQHLTDYASQHQLALPPAVAAPLAAAKLPEASLQRPMEENYFVMLGTIESRKNHWMILQIWRRLVEQMGSRAPRLVLIGKRGWECEHVVDLLDRSEGLQGIVIELPDSTDQEVANYLQHAQALLFPSFAEGYGMPMMEAITFRVPVIASDLQVFKEIAGALPVYLDPLDFAGWLAAVHDLNDPDSKTRKAKLAQMANFELPTWHRHFELVDAMMSGL